MIKTNNAPSARSGRPAPSADCAAREALLLKYERPVRRLAFELSRRVPLAEIYDDLVQAGFIGLLEAAERYSDQAAFRTYAWYRVRGAMLDELRRAYWVPRSVARVARELDGDNPRSAAKALGIDYERHRLNWAGAHLESLDRLREDDGWEPPNGADPLARASFREALGLLAGELARLPQREASVLRQRLKDRTQAQIARRLGVSESRVCQIERKAIQRVRAGMLEGREMPHSPRGGRPPRVICFRGECLSLREWSLRLGGSPSLVWHRLRQHWPLKRALTEPARASTARQRRASS